MTKNDILNELSKNKSYIEQNFEVEKIGLFGSYAKGKQTEDSDIDIYVEFKHKTFDNTLDYILKYNAVSFPSALSEPQVQLVWL